MADRTAGIVALLAIGLILGCQDVPATDLTLCDQTGEFANHGCVEITGTVVGSSGQPLRDIMVGASSGGDADEFDRIYVSTDAQGRFDLRMHQMVSLPGSAADSVSLRIRAVMVPLPPQLVATVKDSALVRLRVTGVGTRPEPVTLNFVLPTP